MVARPGDFLIPQFARRTALQQDQNHLVDIDDDIADPDKIKEPGFLRLRAFLDAQEECNDSDLAESDSLDSYYLPYPTPFERLHKVMVFEQFDMIAQARQDRNSDRGLRYKTKHLLPSGPHRVGVINEPLTRVINAHQ